MGATTVARQNSLANPANSSRVRVTSNGALSLGKHVLGSLTTAGADTAALLAGAGTSTTPAATSVADKNFLGFWTSSSAATGDSRGMYLRHYFTSTGSGEALRVYGTATAANAATGGTINGMHCSLTLNASASVSGQGFSARFTLGAITDTRTLNGNLAVVLLESDIAANNTVPATVSFIKVANTGAVAVNSLLTLPAVANGSIIAAHTAQTNSHSIKIIAGSTVYYIPCHATATGRS